jgi:sorbitol-specific phosphotransferase system component IIC
MQLIKYNLLQILLSYAFRYRRTILRGSFRPKQYKPNTLSYVSNALNGMINYLNPELNPICLIAGIISSPFSPR